MRKRKSFGQTYRLIPIIIGSLLIFVFICGLFILIWSIIAFLSRANVAAVQNLPVFIWLSTLFLAAGFMTLLTRGGTVFPAIFLSLITVAVSCFLASKGILSFDGVLTKLGYSLFFSVLGFTVAKLYLVFIRWRKREACQNPENSNAFFTETERFEEINLQLPDQHGFNEYRR